MEFFQRRLLTGAEFIPCLDCMQVAIAEAVVLRARGRGARALAGLGEDEAVEVAGEALGVSPTSTIPAITAPLAPGSMGRTTRG